MIYISNEIQTETSIFSGDYYCDLSDVPFFTFRRPTKLGNAGYDIIIGHYMSLKVTVQGASISIVNS